MEENLSLFFFIYKNCSLYKVFLSIILIFTKLDNYLNTLNKYSFIYHYQSIHLYNHNLEDYFIYFKLNCKFCIYKINLRIFHIFYHNLFLFSIYFHLSQFQKKMYLKIKFDNIQVILIFLINIRYILCYHYYIHIIYIKKGNLYIFLFLNYKKFLFYIYNLEFLR